MSEFMSPTQLVYEAAILLFAFIEDGSKTHRHEEICPESMMQSWDTNQVFRPQGPPPYPLLHDEEVKLTTSLSLQPPCHHHVGFRAGHMYEISSYLYPSSPAPLPPNLPSKLLCPSAHPLSPTNTVPLLLLAAFYYRFASVVLVPSATFPLTLITTQWKLALPMMQHLPDCFRDSM